MPFPVSLSGSLNVADVTVDRAVDRLEDTLARAHAVELRRTANVIAFRVGGVFRSGSRRDPRLPISSGVVEVRPSGNGVRVTYRLAFTRLVLVVTLVLGAGFGLAVLRSPSLPGPAGFVLVAVCWSWLLGANFVATRWGFRALLRRSVSGRDVSASPPPWA